MSTPLVAGASPRFVTMLGIELFKLKRSLALIFVVVAPLLIAVFQYFNILQGRTAGPWLQTLTSSAALWAVFMLPLGATALTALTAQIEHSTQSWDTLRALPRPRWHLYLSKAVCVHLLIVAMSALLFLLCIAAAFAAGWTRPALMPSGPIQLEAFALNLLRIWLASGTLIAIQFWLSLRFSSFVPNLATGIGGTFFAVAASGAKLGHWMPWQLPINQLASDVAARNSTLLLGSLGGLLLLIFACWQLARRDT